MPCNCKHGIVVVTHDWSTALPIVVCLSVTSRCSTEMAKQTVPRGSTGTLVFWCLRPRQNSSRVTPNGGAKCRLDRLKIGDFWQITCYNSKTLTIASVVNFVRWQVYHTERPPLFAVCLPWCRASHGLVSDSWYLSYMWHVVKFHSENICVVWMTARNASISEGSWTNCWCHYQSAEAAFAHHKFNGKSKCNIESNFY